MKGRNLKQNEKTEENLFSICIEMFNRSLESGFSLMGNIKEGEAVAALFSSSNVR